MKQIKKKIFICYLTRLCDELVRAIENVPPTSVSEDPRGKEYFASRPCWRVHWRSYKKEDDSYPVNGFCESENGHVSKPEVMEWGGLIEGAFGQKRKMMVNSSIPGLNKHALGKWSDFMTFCPTFPGSVVKILHKNNEDSLRPLVAMGVTFRAEDFDALQHASRILYLLEYLNLNGVVELCVCRFFSTFCMDEDGVKRIFKQ